MSNIIRSQSEALDLLGSGRAKRQVSRLVRNEVYYEAGQALVAGTRLEGTAYLTSMAMNYTAILSTKETQIINSVPAADPIQKEQVARRVSMLVDNYTATAASEIARRGH